MVFYKSTHFWKLLDNFGNVFLGSIFEESIKSEVKHYLPLQYILSLSLYLFCEKGITDPFKIQKYESNWWANEMYGIISYSHTVVSTISSSLPTPFCLDINRNYYVCRCQHTSIITNWYVGFNWGCLPILVISFWEVFFRRTLNQK